jgi:hypothetical protein
MTRPQVSTLRVCRVCGALVRAQGMSFHLRSHGITGQSTAREIAEAIRVAQIIKEHQRRGSTSR